MPTKAKKHYPELEDIKEDIDSLKENTIELTKHVKHDGQAKTAELKATATERLDELKASGREHLKDVEKQVKAKPLKSVAIAFATGLAISAILSRRS